jgi:hypothetical protein
VVAYRDSIVSISKQSHGISVRTEAYTAWNDTMALGKKERKKEKKITLSAAVLRPSHRVLAEIFLGKTSCFHKPKSNTDGAKHENPAISVHQIYGKSS